MSITAVRTTEEAPPPQPSNLVNIQQTASSPVTSPQIGATPTGDFSSRRKFYINFAEHLQNVYNPNMLYPGLPNRWSGAGSVPVPKASRPVNRRESQSVVRLLRVSVGVVFMKCYFTGLT
jgi:hypothetical protein